jgi:hypothetical protein
MKNIIQDLLEIKGVKSVKRQSGPVLRINLFSREIKGSDASDIQGNLRKITPRIKSTLDNGRKNGVFSGWEWIVRPEKQYQETSLSRDSISDRKAKGHKPDYYRVSIQE